MKCASCGCSITAEIQKGHHYYRCTKKKGGCQEKRYFREEALIEQIKTFLQKVSLSSLDTEKILFELEKEEGRAKEQAKISVQNLKIKLVLVEQKLEKLLDAYLGEVISAEEYAPRKQKLLVQKLESQEKIKDFEQNGLLWLEPAREFVKSLNQAAKLVESENYSGISTFLKNIGSNHILHDRQFRFVWAEPYDKIAERSEAYLENLPFPKVWRWGELNPRLKELADEMATGVLVLQRELVAQLMSQLPLSVAIAKLGNMTPLISRTSVESMMPRILRSAETFVKLRRKPVAFQRS